MSDFNLKRNGSGYIDTTAFRALNAMPEAGEIWRYIQGMADERILLIIQNHGTFCTALTLVDEDGADRIEINYDTNTKYTDPRMLRYVYNQNFAMRINSIDFDTFESVVCEIHDALPKVRATVVSEKAKQPGIEKRMIPCFDVMCTVFGVEALKNHLKCMYLYLMRNGELESATHHLDILQGLESCGDLSFMSDWGGN